MELHAPVLKNRGKGSLPHEYWQGRARQREGRRAGEPRAPSAHHNAACLGTTPGFLTLKFHWKLCKLMSPSSQADTHIAHVQFHQQNIYNYRNESKCKRDKCQIICTFILSKLLPGTETSSLCNSSYHLVHNIPWANQTLRVLSAKFISVPKSLYSNAFKF